MFIVSIITKRYGIFLLIMITLVLSNMLEARSDKIPPETVLAEYRGGVLTKADFDEEFYKLPEMFRSRYATRWGREEFLKAMVLNHISYLQSLELGIDQEPETFYNYRGHLKPYYAAIFRRREITEQIEITEEDKLKFYEDNPLRFTDQGGTDIEHFVLDDMNYAEEVVKALNEQKDFAEISELYPVRRLTRRTDGIIRNIRSTGFISEIGRDERLYSVISNSPEDEWVGPITTLTGIHFFRVTDRRESVVKPFDEVRDNIRNFLLVTREREKKSRMVDDLKEKYDVAIDHDRLDSLNMFNLRPYDAVLGEKIITSSIPELNITLGVLYEHFRTVSPYIINDDMTRDFEYYGHFQFLSREEWAELSSPETIERLVKNLLEVNLFDYEASQMDYEEEMLEDPERDIIRSEQVGSVFDHAVFENPEVKQLRRHVILKNFFEREVIEVADPGEEEILDYYEANIGRYILPKMRRLRFFPYDTESEAIRDREVVSKALEENNDLEIMELIRQSDYPMIMRAMEQVKKNAGIPGFDEDAAMHDLIWNSELGELSSVHQSESGLYYFLFVTEHIDDYQYPLERFEREIRSTLSYHNRLQRWQELINEMLRDYEVIVYPERLFIVLSAEELFALAEEAQSRRRFSEAIDYYDQIIEHHGNNEDDYRALFSKAYLIARELRNEEKAETLFRQLLDEYPRGDLHDSAEFMLQSFADIEIPEAIFEQ